MNQNQQKMIEVFHNLEQLNEKLLELESNRITLYSEEYWKWRCNLAKKLIKEESVNE